MAELTNSPRVGRRGRMLTNKEKEMHAVDSYATTESDKTRGTARLLLSRNKTSH